ncbi:hypothetical protein EI427_21065 [Flammeovirga pectinis]|uniref:Uncharacterized protein n=1 Tax=Flammeovirga pectinis TaxID=2494373 RepID=A0A3Q9FRH9_9BACT|nr:hypothetical protein [Flammeovirga pectinis]AZQ64717.1 hypothetical protein EI427_21065 [Flammeovirga pectinis]
MYENFTKYETLYKENLSENDFNLLRLLSLKTIRNKSVTNRNNDQEWVANFDEIIEYYNIRDFSNFYGQVGARHLSNTPFTKMIESRSKKYQFDEYLYYNGKRIYNEGDPKNIHYNEIEFCSWEFKFRPMITRKNQMKSIKVDFFSKFESISKYNEILKINDQTVIINSQAESYCPLQLK